MSNPSHLIQAAFNAPNLPRKSIGQRAYVGLLIATTGASVLCGGSAALDAAGGPLAAHGRTA